MRIEIAIGLIFLAAAACVQTETQRKRAIETDVYDCIKQGGEPSREWKDGQRVVVCRPQPRKESRLPQFEGKDLPPGHVCLTLGAADDCMTKPRPLNTPGDGEPISTQSR